MTQALFPDPPSMDAHRRLVRAALADLELPSPFEEYPDNGLYVAWREAEAVQTTILGGWESEARDTIERLVEHIIRLATRTSWFLADPERRKSAIEETIVHNAYGWTVTSQLAQDAWLAVWATERRRMSDVLDLVFDAGEGSLNEIDLAETLADSEEIPLASLFAAEPEALWRAAWDWWADAGRW